MKSIFYWILSFLTILTLTLSADKSALAEQQKATRLVFVSYQPELTASALTDKWFLGEVTKRSSGRINFDCYWSEILLKAKDIFPELGKERRILAQHQPALITRIWHLYLEWFFHS